MRTKTIKVEHKFAKEVLLQIFRDEDGDDKMIISAWHLTDDGPLYQSSYLFFNGFSDEYLMMERYINDFSSTSAIDFVDSFKY